MAPNSGFSYGNIVSVYSGESNPWQGHKNVYKYEDFSEFYKGTLGFYGIINGGFIHYNACGSYDSAGNCAAKKYDLFQCPETYPYSAKGSKSLSDCFKYDANGNKIYYGSTNYGNCNIDAIRATVQNLQQALIKAAQDLQDALDKSYKETENMPYTTPSIQTSRPIKPNNDKIEEKVKNLNKIDTTNKIDAVKQTTGKRAASGPFKSNILNTYVGAQ